MQNTARIVDLSDRNKNVERYSNTADPQSWQHICQEVQTVLDPEVGDEPIVIWRGADNDTYPVRMECERYAPGLKTVYGDMIDINTHFLTEDEAWRNIIESAEAGVSMAGRDVIDAETQLARAQETAAAAAKHFMLSLQRYDSWKRKNK